MIPHLSDDDSDKPASFIDLAINLLEDFLEADFTHPAAPCAPTEVLPGPSKVAVFEERYRLRQELFAAGDPGYVSVDRAGLLLVAEPDGTHWLEEVERTADGCRCKRASVAAPS